MKLAYRRRIEGVSTWGIVHNSAYFLVNISVFEDGSINCWGIHDLVGLKKQIDCGWLVTQVPKGKGLSISGLGTIEVRASNLVFNQKSYYEYLYQTVKKMNSKMEGLYVQTNEMLDSFKKRKVSYIAHEYPIKQDTQSDYKSESISVFRKISKDLYDIDIIACYEDHTFMLNSNEGTYMSYDQLSELFRKGELTAEIQEPAWFRLGDMGKVYGKVTFRVCNNENKLDEILEVQRNVCKEETFYKQCQKLYTAYLIHPSEFLRQKLKEVYELIPEHERHYLGDMDSKDSDYYRIIYNPEEKREV